MGSVLVGPCTEIEAIGQTYRKVVRFLTAMSNDLARKKSNESENCLTSVCHQRVRIESNDSLHWKWGLR